MLPSLLTVLATALSLLVVDLIVPGVDLDNFVAAMIAAFAIGILNSTIKPALSLLTLPINLLTFGSFSLVVNGICLGLAAAFVPGFSMHGIVAFFLAPVILSMANTFLNSYFAERSAKQDNLS